MFAFAKSAARQAWPRPPPAGAGCGLLLRNGEVLERAARVR